MSKFYCMSLYFNKGHKKKQTDLGLCWLVQLARYLPFNAANLGYIPGCGFSVLSLLMSDPCVQSQELALGTAECSHKTENIFWDKAILLDKLGMCFSGLMPVFIWEDLNLIHSMRAHPNTRKHFWFCAQEWILVMLGVVCDAGVLDLVLCM